MNGKPAAFVPVTVRLPGELFDAVAARAGEAGVPYSEVVRRAIAVYCGVDLRRPRRGQVAG
jgi:hypothetical protein